MLIATNNHLCLFSCFQWLLCAQEKSRHELRTIPQLSKLDKIAFLTTMLND